MNVRKKNAIIFMAIATCCWVIYKLVWNVKKIISIPSDILCHTQELLTLREVVEYFKNQPMQPDEETPFIVSDWNKIFSKKIFLSIEKRVTRLFLWECIVTTRQYDIIRLCTLNKWIFS